MAARWQHQNHERSLRRQTAKDASSVRKGVRNTLPHAESGISQRFSAGIMTAAKVTEFLFQVTAGPLSTRPERQFAKLPHNATVVGMDALSKVYCRTNEQPGFVREQAGGRSENKRFQQPKQRDQLYHGRLIATCLTMNCSILIQYQAPVGGGSKKLCGLHPRTTTGPTC